MKRVISLLISIIIAVTLQNCSPHNSKNSYDEKTENKNLVRLFLPDTVYMSASDTTEYNIYYDNCICVPNYHNYYFDVDCEVGKSFEQGWKFTPKDGTDTIHNFTLSVYNWDGNLIESKSTTLKISDNDNVSKEDTILVIGNSLTNANVYPAELYELSSKRLNFIGTCDTKTNSPNEGYGGKTFHWFISNTSSPFVFKDSSSIDIKTYLDSNNFNKPNLITIMLGINDFIRRTTIAEFDSITTFCDSMVANFTSEIPDVKLGLVYIVGPSHSQNAAGTNYSNKLERWKTKRNFHLWNELLKGKYGVGGTHYNPQVTLIPANLGLDTKHNMKTKIEKYNSRNKQTYHRQSNSVHPAKSGYKQIADFIYGWIVNKTNK